MTVNCVSNKLQHLAQVLDQAQEKVYDGEDLVEDAVYRIKLDPFRSVGITFGVGSGLGLFAGWLVIRQAHRNCQ